ncbi:HAMP domain-containing sensor histidine kinase [Nocardioides sp.]|uniref:sensor histidine kinase n=1 Tax=Nocardioides sp. TaxID=35761 RepID=UPI00260949B9|nr:HAMP domain-containing sensor histidine kinase [Nocardioides sp.]
MPPRHSFSAGAEPWPDALTRSSLQVYVDGLIGYAGFGMAVISVLREDGNFHVAAVAGATPEEEAEIRALRTPATLVRTLLREAEDWGLFKFVAGDSTPIGPEWGWVPEMAPVDAEDAWDPEDCLIAPLCDSVGTVIGSLSVDLPPGGRRPDHATRDLLNRYAAQAGRAMVSAIERRSLSQQASLAQAARVLVNEATINAPLADDFVAISERLTTLFGLSHVRIRVLDVDTASLQIVTAPGAADDAMRATIDTVFQELWERQEVLVLGPDQQQGEISPAAVERLRAYLTALGAGSLLAAPIGSGREALGLLSLARPPERTLWTDRERDTVLEICRDLGRVLVSARMTEEQKVLTRELREIHTRRSTLIRTVAHELKNPLTVLNTNLELIESGLLAPTEVPRTLARMATAEGRMSRLIDDLSALTRASARAVAPTPHDLGRMVTEACDLVCPDDRGLRLVLVVPPTPVLVDGEASSLDRVVMNLVSNAVKYTDPGGTVQVVVRLDGEYAELAVSDSGIGIGEEDRKRLFHEFFRGTNVEDRPGTGLGLTIAARIVGRLGGTIEVESALGVGSLFRVRLPLHGTEADA